MKRYHLVAKAFTFSAISCLLLFMFCAKAAEFSADIIATDAAGKPTAALGKVYMSDDKARIETKNLSDGFFVVDAKKDTAYFVRPEKKIFMDAKQSSPLTQVLVPLDPQAPCQKFEAMAINAGLTENEGQWLCNRQSDPSAEPGLITYSAISPKQKHSTIKIDLDLKALVSSQPESEEGFVLKNIQKGPQKPELFDIPIEYKKFDPRQLIEVLKKSDVWVEPKK